METDAGFNLVIEVLFFSSLRSDSDNYCVGFSCFNLVIEVLFFSRYGTFTRMSFGVSLFQSRNRGSFLFKQIMSVATSLLKSCGFNLVIEVLFFSRLSLFVRGGLGLSAETFQSRNRGSFLFKLTSARFCMPKLTVSIS